MTDRARRLTLIWLRSVAALHVVGGLALALGPLLGTDALYLPQLMAQLDPTAAATPALRHLFALFGPTIASYGVLLLVLLRGLEDVHDRPRVLGTMLAVALWFALDAGLSAAWDMDGFVILDGLAAAALLVPLAILARRGR